MDQPKGLLEPVAAAARCVGGVTRLAEILGIKRPALYQWTRVPAERVASIEEATEGKVTRHQLRPDLYPADREHAA
jgi:DNA-binding transcriptional regulator YdaS (Cro superfamily)